MQGVDHFKSLVCCCRPGIDGNRVAREGQREGGQCSRSETCSGSRAKARSGTGPCCTTARSDTSTRAEADASTGRCPFCSQACACTSSCACFEASTHASHTEVSDESRAEFTRYGVVDSEWEVGNGDWFVSSDQNWND